MPADIAMRKDRQLRAGAWLGFAEIIVALAVALPLLAIVAIAFTPQDNIWPHLISTVLPGYIWRTAALLIGVGVLTTLAGTLAAWLVAMHEFPFRRLFQWASLLPLAMPVYITSYTYVAFLNYSGPVQSGLRQAFDWNSPADYWFPEIRSIPGAVFVLSAVLYPYVFMTAQAGFMRMPASQLDAARSLGRGPFTSFWKVALPQTRPAIAVGVSLALMEVLNDVAAVNFFGVNTLTLGIFNTLQIDGNLGGAAQLSLVLLVFVIGLLWVERRGQRKKSGKQATGQQVKDSRLFVLKQWQGWLAATGCALPIVFGFVVPASILAYHAVSRIGSLDIGPYLRATSHSLSLALVASVIVVAIGLLLTYAQRRASVRAESLLRLSTLGYAVPGTILGIGVLVPFAAFDNALHALLMAQFGWGTGLLLSGTIAALVYAYAIRFLAISFGTLETGLAKVTPNITAAARTLGRTPMQTVLDVHLPILRPALVSAALLVFVDCMKELPATLILRPFDFETLSTLVYNLASLDQLEESAIPALTIVAAGIVPVMLLARNLREPWFKP
jgi:iron(III) transport system permease protein